MTVRAFSICVFVVILLFFVAKSAVAGPQWKQICRFPSGDVTAVYFLYDCGHPNIGFAAAGTGGFSIYRTLDTGRTWIDVFDYPDGQVTSFTFLNADTGFFSVMFNSLGTPAIYKTEDIGMSWLGSQGLLGWASEIYYNPGNKLLFVSSRGYLDACLTSADGGSTWKRWGLSVDQNSFAFSYTGSGFLSAVSTSWFVTGNNGASWSQTSADQFHCWAPIFAHGTTQYFAPEDFGNDVLTNGGNVDFSTSGRDLMTGCAQANDCNVFVQTYGGMFTRDMATKDWLPVGGGPGNAVDTRFQVAGYRVYAGNRVGMLFAIDIGGTPWPSLTFKDQGLSFSARLGCKQLLDSIDFSYPYCGILTLDSVSVSDLHFRVVRAQLPSTLTQKTDIRLYVQALTSDTGTFKTRLHLWMHTPSFATDTTVPLTLHIAGITPPTLSAISVTLIDHCTTGDTTFAIKNNHCDSMHLLSLVVADTTHVSMDSVALPLSLAPEETVQAHLHYHSMTDGSFSTVLKLKYQIGTVDFDTTIPFRLKVKKAYISTTLSSYTLDFDSLGPCEQAERRITLTNTSCDSMEITSFFIHDGHMVSPFYVVSPRPSTWIHSGDSITIIIGCNGSKDFGLDTGFVRLTYGNNAYETGDDVQLQVVFVPSLALVRLSDSAFDFGVRPFCSPDSVVTLTIRNPLCDTLYCSNLGVSGSVEFQLLDSADKAIAPRDSLVEHITFHALVHGYVQGLFHIHFSSSGGLLPQDTSVLLQASITHGSARLRLGDSAIDFGSMRICESRDRVLWLHNPGCDSLRLDSLLFDNPSFTSETAIQGLAIAAGDSVPVSIRFTPDPAVLQNTIDGSATVYAAASDSTKLIAVPLRASLTYPGILSLQVVGGVVASSISDNIIKQNGRGQARDGITYYVLLTGVADIRDLLESVSFAITNNDDLLSYRDDPAVHIDSIARAANTALTTRFFTISPVPQSDTLATLNYDIYLAQAKTSSLVLSNAIYKTTIGLPNDCIASIQDSDASFSYIDGCTDSLIRELLSAKPISLQDIYPNPARDLLRVEGAGPVGLEVYDVMGRQLLIPQADSNGGMQLDIRGLAEGMYYLRVGNSTSRFVIER